MPDSANVPSFTGHAQTYAISCEARAAVDLAGYWGIYIGETEFLEALPRADNPDKGFVGSPNDVWGRIPPQGYGVHADPVAETLREYGLEAEAQHDMSWDDLREEISAGRPVIVWVIGTMWDGKATDYQAPDGSISRVANFEHTMTLVGYGPDTVQAVDSSSGLRGTYSESTFLNSWAVLGNMAVTASYEQADREPSAIIYNERSYTVQKGDHVMALARSFGVSWMELIQLNSLVYPYTIYPGQVLQVPGSEEPVDEDEPDQPAAGTDKDQTLLPMVQRNLANPKAPAVQASAKAVVVAVSETLASFGQRIGVDWHLLVKLNGLRPPYIVHPGQVLRLR